MGVVLKILSGYISGGTWSQVGWRPFRRDPRTDSSQLVGEWTAEPTTLAQTTLTMVGASEIGGSRLTLDELSPDSPLSVTTARPRERARGGRRHPTTDTVDDHRRRQMAGWRGHFHFHTTRLEGFSSTETPHSDNFWRRPDRTRLPPEDEEGCWSGSFP